MGITIWTKLNKVFRLQSTSKEMTGSLFDYIGPVAINRWDNQKAVKYSIIYVPKKSNQKNNEKYLIILQDDNASSHPARKTIDYLKEKRQK